MASPPSSSAPAAATPILAATVPFTGDLVVSIDKDSTPIKLTAYPSGLSEEGIHFTYQWFRGSKAIKGATGADYFVKAKDRDKFIKVRVTAKKSGYVTQTLTTPPQFYTIIGDTPTISGSVGLGNVLTAELSAFTVGSASIDPDLTYQWYRNNKRISGQTAETYTIVDADLGKRLSVKVTGSAEGTWLPFIRTSDKTEVVREAAFDGTLGGSAYASYDGDYPLLDVSTFGIADDGVVIKVQWFRNGNAITKLRTTTTYKLTKKDYGKYISAKIVATKPGFTQQVLWDEPIDYSLHASGKPTLDIPQPHVGETVTVTPPAYSPSTSLMVRYQWYRDGKAISGATTDTYTLVGADKGKRLSVKVTALRATYIPSIQTVKATKDTRKALV